MILADTSVWIDHMRSENKQLTVRLRDDQVLMHPMVIGELACGNLPNREETLTDLMKLPIPPVATDDEVLFFIERHRLMGRGIGYIDAHLLASVEMSDSALLWTLDRRLRDAATELSIAYSPEQERRTIP